MPRAADLIQRLLYEASIRPHSVTSRVKSRESAIRKIESKNAGYSLANMTDILGVRITTYFQDEVDTIASLIEDQFEIDRENSADRRILLDPDRFGYLSLHYIVQLKEPRRSLLEYQRFQQTKFEIQIRSILQHAWAEIEHDLGYKTKNAVPTDIQRRFSRLAGLLELADTEFVRIREDLSKHQQNVRKAVLGSDLDVPIDRDSIIAYIESSPLVQRLDRSIADSFELSLRKTSLGGASVLASDMQVIGIKTIHELDRKLAIDGDKVVSFLQQVLTKKSKVSKELSRGAAVRWLGPFEAASLEEDQAKAILEIIKFPLAFDIIKSARRKIK